MKIYFNRLVKRSPWGGGAHFMTNLVDELVSRGHNVIFNFEPEIDIIFMMDPRHEEGGSSIREIYEYKTKYPKTKIIHRINECDARKNTNEIDKILVLSNTISDITVFISEWLKDYFIKKGLNRSSSPVIYNGCNSSHFFPKKVSESLSYPIKIVTHHWSDNWMKGFDAYRDLDRLCQKNPQKYKFTYIGRYCKEYSPASTTVIRPLYGEELGEELRKHDIYITASRWEPCGMHHIEGAASGLPVLYHTDGGGIPEGCRKHGIEFNSQNLESKLGEIIEKRDALLENIDYDWLSSKRCINSYVEIIEGIK